jgi:hypothetical protein
MKLLSSGYGSEIVLKRTDPILIPFGEHGHFENDTSGRQETGVTLGPAVTCKRNALVHRRSQVCTRYTPSTVMIDSVAKAVSKSLWPHSIVLTIQCIYEK